MSIHLSVFSFYYIFGYNLIERHSLTPKAKKEKSLKKLYKGGTKNIVFEPYLGYG